MKIIKVEPITQVISMTWMIGKRCNYDCMYCPTAYHDDTSGHPDFEQLKQAWINFYNKTANRNLPYKIGFTGGEVTANKHFIPLIEFIRSGNYNIDQLLVTTNGSASLSYYQKLSTMVESISFSTHSEHFNEQEFFHKVKAINDIMIRPVKSVHVNIMNEFWNQERTKMYQDWCDANNISNSVNEIDYSLQTRTMPIMKGTLNLAA